MVRFTSCWSNFEFKASTTEIWMQRFQMNVFASKGPYNSNLQRLRPYNNPQKNKTPLVRFTNRFVNRTKVHRVFQNRFAYLLNTFCDSNVYQHCLYCGEMTLKPHFNGFIPRIRSLLSYFLVGPI